MSTNTRFNILFGEKYGDVQDPKTAWSNHGNLMVGTNYQKEQADPADVEALARLVEGGYLRLRVTSLPAIKVFDGWLSIFTPRDRDQQAPSNGQVSSAKSTVENIDDKPIDLSEIPF